MFTSYNGAFLLYEHGPEFDLYWIDYFIMSGD